MRRTLAIPSLYRYPGHAIASSIIHTFAKSSPSPTLKPDLLTPEQINDIEQSLREHAFAMVLGGYQSSEQIGPFVTFGRGSHSRVYAHRSYPHILIKIKPSEFVADEVQRYQTCAQIVTDEGLDRIQIPRFHQTSPIWIDTENQNQSFSAFIQEKMTLVDRDDETHETVAMLGLILNNQCPSVYSGEMLAKAKLTFESIVAQSTLFVLHSGFWDIGPNFPRIMSTGRIAAFDFEGVPKQKIPFSIADAEQRIEALSRLGRVINHPIAHGVMINTFRGYLDRVLSNSGDSLETRSRLVADLVSTLGQCTALAEQLKPIRDRYIQRGVFQPEVVHPPLSTLDGPPRFTESICRIISSRKIDRYPFSSRSTFIMYPTIISDEMQQMMNSIFTLDMIHMMIPEVFETDGLSQCDVQHRFHAALDWLMSQDVVTGYQAKQTGCKVWF